MPARNCLTPSQKATLQKALRDSDDRYMRQRILMLLLMNDGKTYQEISDFLGCAYRSVAYWCVHGDPDNLESLRDKRSRGNHRKATDDYVQRLIEIAKQEPRSLGCDFKKWTGENLATYLAKETGIELSGTQVRRILKKKKHPIIRSYARAR